MRFTSAGSCTWRPASSVNDREIGAESCDLKPAGAIPVWAGAGVPSGSKKHNTHRRGAAFSVFAEFSVHRCNLNFIDSLCAKKSHRLQPVLQKKRPTRKWGATPHPFSRRVPAPTAWEGVLTYGVSPITVAGPWPIRTAFPASHAYSMSGGSLCRKLRGVNRRCHKVDITFEWCSV